MSQITALYRATRVDARLTWSTRKLRRAAESMASEARACRADDPRLAVLQAQRNALRDELARRGISLSAR